MKVTVIIPVKNAEKYIGQIFASLELQTCRPEQVLVIDSSSTDDTVNVCKSYGADVIGIDEEDFDHGGTRNLGAAKASGNVLVYVTQDVLIRDSRCIEKLISPLADPGIGASYGRQIAREDADPIERFQRSFNYPKAKVVKGLGDLPEMGIKTFIFSNVCSAIRKKAFEDVGGFPERTIANEDMSLAAKLMMGGYSIAYQPEAIVYHSHNFSLLERFRRYFAIGVYFKGNPWISCVAPPWKEGFKFFVEELRFLGSRGCLMWTPYALADVAVRFLGYRMGLMEEYIPHCIKKRLVDKTNFWEKETSELNGRAHT